MDPRNFSKLTIAGLVLVSGLMTVGCGKNDPIADYPQLKDRTQMKPGVDTPSAFRKDVFDITAEPLEFQEGRAGKKRVMVKFGASNVKYSIAISKGPHDAVLEGLEANVFNLSWAPPKGYLNGGAPEIDLELEVTIDPATPAETQEYLRKEYLKREFKIKVLPGEGLPQIALKGLPERMVEGGKTPFTVEVSGPINESAPLELKCEDIEAEKNIGLYDAGGCKYISDSSPAQKADGKYIFSRVFDATKMENPHPKKGSHFDGLFVRFELKAVNGENQTVSLPVIMQVTFNPEMTKPQFVWNSGKETVAAGESVKYVFKVASQKGLGATEVKDISQPQLSSFPGGAKLTCGAQASATKSCAVTWAIPCNVTGLPATYKMSFEAKNSLNPETVLNEKTITIDRVAARCNSPKPGAKPAPLKKN